MQAQEAKQLVEEMLLLLLLLLLAPKTVAKATLTGDSISHTQGYLEPSSGSMHSFTLLPQIRDAHQTVKTCMLLAT